MSDSDPRWVSVPRIPCGVEVRLIDRPEDLIEGREATAGVVTERLVS